MELLHTLATEQPIPPGDDSWDSDDILPPQSFDVWTRTNVGENMPFPVTPLTITNFPAMFKLDATQPKPGEAPTQGTRRFYGRLYINEGAIVHNFTEQSGLPSSFLDRMWGSKRRGEQQVNTTFRPLRFLRWLPSLLRQGFAFTKPKGPKQTPEQFFAQIDQWVNEFQQHDLSQLDDRTLWAEVGLPLWRERGEYVFSKNLQLSVPSGLAYAALEWLVDKWTGKKEATHDLVTGLDGMFNAEVGPALWQMVETLRGMHLEELILKNDALTALSLLRTVPAASTLNAQLTRFLQRHGHRCPNELEYLNPRWSEAPEQVIELLRHYLQADERMNPVKAEQVQREKRDQAIAQIAARLDPLRRAIFRKLLKNAQRAVTVRDNSRYYVTKFTFPMRQIYALLGQRWTERGWLAQPADIFFLTLKEVQRVIETGTPEVLEQDMRTSVVNRRLAYDYWFTIVPPDALGPDGKALADAEEPTDILKGTPASGGQVQGRARIVQNVQEAMCLTSGDILITRATDPGWTPIFPLVSGIVLEIGGQLSHGAIVAREYGLPAVVNVQGAMRVIKDGQIITVDGTKGVIYLK